MTRKDFELIAGVLYRSRPSNETIIAVAAWERVRDDMADALYSTNSAFNRDKFVRFANTGGYK